MEEHDHKAMVRAEYSPKEVLKFVLVIAAIFAAAFALTSVFGPNSLENWLRWFMGVFFVVFASFKLVGYKMFALMFAGYDIIAKRFKPYAYAYPFIELALGLFYVFNVLPVTREWLTILIFGIGSIGVLQEVKKRTGIHCACLGNVIKLPLSTVSLIEDVAMVAMAAFMLLVF